MAGVQRERKDRCGPPVQKGEKSESHPTVVFSFLSARPPSLAARPHADHTPRLPTHTHAQNPLHLFPAMGATRTKRAADASPASLSPLAAPALKRRSLDAACSPGWLAEAVGNGPDAAAVAAVW